MRAFATHAEAIGLDSLWVCDHFLSGPAGRPAVIDAYERLDIDDLIVRLQPSTQPALDRLARAIEIRRH